MPPPHPSSTSSWITYSQSCNVHLEVADLSRQSQCLSCPFTVAKESDHLVKLFFLSGLCGRIYNYNLAAFIISRRRHREQLQVLRCETSRQKSQGLEGMLEFSEADDTSRDTSANRQGQPQSLLGNGITKPFSHERLSEQFPKSSSVESGHPH